jgi:inosose dehydratase
MPADRLLREAASIGLEVMEAGPEDFLPPDHAEVKALLFGHGLGLVGGFVPAVMHERQIRQEGLDLVGRRAKFFPRPGRTR